jgi:tRNA(fMet)-specific endonuclease VapC
MIASHAAVLDLTVVTNDITEFRRVPGLRCEDWTR